MLQRYLLFVASMAVPVFLLFPVTYLVLTKLVALRLQNLWIGVGFLITLAVSGVPGFLHGQALFERNKIAILLVPVIASVCTLLLLKLILNISSENSLKTNPKWHRSLGWFRLGVIVSIMWLIAASIFAYGKFRHSIDQTVASIYETRDLGDWTVVGMKTTYFDCEFTGRLPNDAVKGLMVIESNTSCSPRFVSLAILYVSALAVVWIIIPFSVWSFDWIRNGFRS